MPMDPEAVSAIPMIDLGPFLAGAPGALEETAVAWRQVRETVGFLTVTNHGVAASPMDETIAHAVRLHAQPNDVKMEVKADAIMRGVVPLRGNTTRSSNLGAGNTATRVFAYMAYDELIAIDRHGDYHPRMLQGWTISDDRLTYTFRLRDGLTWSDGSAVTAGGLRRFHPPVGEAGADRWIADAIHAGHQHR